MAQDDAVIRVRLDMDQLDRDLREVERRGGQAAGRVASGQGGGGAGGGKTGGGGGKGGGTMAGVGRMLPGGATAAAGAGMLSKVMTGGLGVAAIAAAAFTANFPTTAAAGGGMLKGAVGGVGRAAGDIMNAAAAGPAAGMEHVIFGDRAANARGNVRALDQTVAAASLAVGFGADADTFAPYFEAVQSIEQRRERGALELRRRFGSQVTAETVGSGTGANSESLMKIAGNIENMLGILVAASRQGSLLGQLGLK